MRRFFKIFTILIVTATFFYSNKTFSYSIKTTKSGEPVRWMIEDITFYLDSSLEKLGPKMVVYVLIINAFDSWIENCDIPISIHFKEKDCQAEYISNGKNNNCISAREGNWSEENGIGAVTRSTFIEETGVLVDADIVFSSDRSWAFDGRHGSYDIGSVIFHEAGHVFGMAHSESSDAIMHEKLNIGSVKQALAKDDIDGATYLYEFDEENIMQATCSFSYNTKKKISFFALILQFLAGLI